MVGSTPPSRCVPPKFPGKKVNFRSPSRDDRLPAVSRGTNSSIQAFPKADRAELVLPGRGWKTEGSKSKNLLSRTT